jgi:hypothetical protein
MEVAMAVGEYFRRVGRPVPRGEVVRCRADGGIGGVPVRFQITLGPESGGSKSQKAGRAPSPDEFLIVVEEADVAAALILACRSRRIPLPSKSGKKLQVFGEQVGLVFTMAAATPEVGPPEKVTL